MSKKIVTNTNKKPIFKIVMLFVLLILVVSMTFIIISTKKNSKDKEVTNDNDVIDVVQEPNDNDNLIPSDKNEDLENIDNTQEPEEIPDNNLNTGDNLDYEDIENKDGSKPIEQWQVGKNGPQDPEVDIELNEEQIARSKTGGYYDGAYVELEELISSIGMGTLTELPEGMPRFFNVEKELKLVEEVEKPTPGKEIVSALTLETLEYIDRNVDRTDEKNRNRLYEDHFKSNVTKNLDALRAASENSMRKVEEATGIIADEKFYEQLITSEVHSARNRLFTEARKEDHPYKEALRAHILRGKINGRGVPEYETNGYEYIRFYDAVPYWLENGGEYSPDIPETFDYERSYYYSFVNSDILYQDFSNPKVILIGYRTYESRGETHKVPYVYVLVGSNIYEATFSFSKDEQILSNILK